MRDELVAIEQFDSLLEGCGTQPWWFELGVAAERGPAPADGRR
jgi:hypothetical protein